MLQNTDLQNKKMTIRIRLTTVFKCLNWNNILFCWTSSPHSELELPNSANKNIGCSAKFEFQINNE